MSFKTKPAAEPSLESMSPWLKGLVTRLRVWPSGFGLGFQVPGFGAEGFRFRIEGVGSASARSLSPFHQDR